MQNKMQNYASTRLYTGRIEHLSPQIAHKHAMLIGLNYPGTSNELQGCINDVENLKAYLTMKGFVVTLLKDPSKIELVANVRRFAQQLRPLDVGLLWYSGHGTMTNRGNAWVPRDWRRNGFVPESDIRSILHGARAGVRFFVGSDSCYSGSFLNLRFDVEAGRGQLRAETAASLRSGLIRANHVAETVHDGVPRTINESFRIDTNSLSGGDANFALYDTRTGSIRPVVIFISGCRDNQTSAEALVNGSIQGAMTWAFLQTLSANVANLGHMQQAMRLLLSNSGFSQVPQLSVSTSVSPHTLLSHIGL